jgi:hypothetical protein
MSTASDGQPESHVMRGGAVRLVCALAAAQLGLHAWFAVSAGGPRMWMPHAVAWLLDVFVLIVAAAPGCCDRRGLPQAKRVVVGGVGLGTEDAFGDTPQLVSQRVGACSQGDACLPAVHHLGGPRGTRSHATAAQTSSRRVWSSVPIRIDDSQPAKRSLRGRRCVDRQPDEQVGRRRIYVHWCLMQNSPDCHNRRRFAQNS